MKVDLNGKSAIVTGGSKGYGTGIAEALKNKGMNVYITGRDQSALDSVSESLGVSALKADVTSSGDWDRVIQTVMDETGQLDVLVNNAGAGVKIGPLAEMSDEEIQNAIDVNLTGTAFGCRRAARIMVAQKSGTIINVSSACQRQAWPGWSIYSAAKAGMGQLSNCLYGETREHGVRVTTLIPSWGATGFLDAAGLDGFPEDIESRCIKPSEIGDLVVTICELPEHLEIQDLTLWPRVQQVEPL